ncbi:class I SAM-dependent methyltransferase [Ochrobactrum sp. AN78]|uniref:class I SAM-dependent methyltransferase n=1 Tax=Ochrobactrum sp. AN78 TaxID=3039853 RepID=UPI002989EE36|nr:class I SAM-dependent methyltransferase [Ochrobactrum sp. AN78]MDH7793547.1 ubiquinone/menaquinone biosynthesis C-methylase UbiE [Ochrobactrum sp. AN78]
MKSLRTEQFLLYAHQRFPGMTSSCFASEAGNLIDDRSTYDRLVDIIPQGDEGTIIDLACGDGYRCQRLVAFRPKGAKIIGIDFSPDEIQAAEERLSGSHVRLLCARAQELPIASQSADYVLCHMALMLMTELDRVVDELARVLKHGSVFSCIIPTGSEGPGRMI